MLKSNGFWAALVSVALGLSGCIERMATADPDQSAQDAQAPDAAADAQAPDAQAPDGAAPDGQVVFDQGALVDARAVDARVVDAALVDALPPPVDAAAVETDCAFPEPPPRDCSPAGAGLGDAQALPFQSAARDSAFNALRVALADGCRLEYPESGQHDFASEAEFQAAVVCFEGVESIPSTVDWVTTRLVTATLQDGLGEVIWVVSRDGETRLGIDVGLVCSGAAPEAGFVAAFISADAPPLGEPFGCLPQLGPQGCCACAVICDPEPRILECDCPP